MRGASHLGKKKKKKGNMAGRGSDDVSTLTVLLSSCDMFFWSYGDDDYSCRFVHS